MNISSVFGTLILGAALFFGVYQSTSDLGLFFDPTAFLLVFGGTLGISLLAFPYQRLQDLIDFLVYGIFLKRKTDDVKNVIDLIRMAHFYKMNPKEFLHHVHLNYIFLQEAALLLSQENLSAEEIHLILQNRRNSFRKKYQEEHKMLSSIAKFPPALGLLASSVHIIELLFNFSDAGFESLGGGLSLAIVSSFWGMALANIFLWPLCDYGARVAEEDLFSRDLVIHGITLTKQGYPVSTISEAMISELPISEQIILRGVIFKSQTAESFSQAPNKAPGPKLDPQFFKEKTKSPPEQNNSKVRDEAS